MENVAAHASKFVGLSQKISKQSIIIVTFVKTTLYFVFVFDFSHRTVSPSEGTPKVVCVCCETCSRYKRFSVCFECEPHRVDTFPPVFLEVEFYFLYVYNRFYEKSICS